nr:immunoglobulin light chain junction region [Macaca mulatta]MPN81123.1 immunoglobulin light chain junction region [Macaca mulatta]
CEAWDNSLSGQVF